MKPCTSGQAVFADRSCRFSCGRSKFLSKFLKILVKKIREIFPETGTYFFDKFTEKNRDLGALNDGGAIKGLEVREGDGVYITYADGADTVSKKLGDHVDPGTLISQTSVSFNQEWNQGHAYSGKTEVPCSKATITCNGFNNHNGSLTVYDSSGTVLETISIVSGTYTINKDDICRWNIGYNFPQGYASIGASFTVSLYK